jgi:hypothetical protein
MGNGVSCGIFVSKNVLPQEKFLSAVFLLSSYSGKRLKVISQITPETIVSCVIRLMPVASGRAASAFYWKGVK